jgi:hypothetical protein
VFVIIGRIPDHQNSLFQSSKNSWADAKKEFADWLWKSEDPEDREQKVKEHGADNFIEAAFQVDGPYKILVDPVYGER